MSGTKLETQKDIINWWFSKDPTIRKEVDSHCEKIDREHQALRDKGYVLIYRDIAYTQQDIDEGKCPANGLLKDLGLKK